MRRPTALIFLFFWQLLFWQGVVLSAPSALSALEPVAEWRSSQLHLKAVLTSEPAPKELRISLTGTDLEVLRIFRLAEPDRLVVDCAPLPLTRNETIGLRTNPWVKQIRLGLHPDKLRLVLDLQSSNYSYSSEQKGATLFLSLRDSDRPDPQKAETTPAAVATPAVRPTATPSPVPTPGPTIAAIKILKAERSTPRPSPTPELGRKIEITTPSPLPSVEPTAAPTPETAAPPTAPTTAPPTVAITSGQNLVGIDFGRHPEKRTPLVKLKMAQRPHFTLTRASPRLYRLTIAQCGTSAEHLLLPHFAPFDLEGFNLVQAQPEGRSLTVSIQIDRDYRLTASAQASEIWLEATPP